MECRPLGTTSPYNIILFLPYFESITLTKYPLIGILKIKLEEISNSPSQHYL